MPVDVKDSTSATGGRDGEACIDDGVLAVRLATPKARQICTYGNATRNNVDATLALA